MLHIVSQSNNQNTAVRKQTDVQGDERVKCSLMVSKSLRRHANYSSVTGVFVFGRKG